MFCLWPGLCQEKGKGLDLNDRTKCLYCPQGFYKVKTGNGCQKCEAGTYSSGGEDKCKRCSDVNDAKPLSLPGAKSEYECLPLCGSGQGYRLSGATANTGRFFKATNFTKKIFYTSFFLTRFVETRSWTSEEVPGWFSHRMVSKHHWWTVDTCELLL